jgi:hypothetical protein
MGKLSLCSAGKAAAGKDKAGEGSGAAPKITSFLLDRGAAAAGAGAGGATPSTKLKPGAVLGGCSSQHAAAVPYGKAAAAHFLVLVLCSCSCSRSRWPADLERQKFVLRHECAGSPVAGQELALSWPASPPPSSHALLPKKKKEFGFFFECLVFLWVTNVIIIISRGGEPVLRCSLTSPFPFLVRAPRSGRSPRVLTRWRPLCS